MTKAAIPVLLSRQAIAPAERRLPEPATPLEPIGVTYSMAQETRWIDRDTFAIGRWDGTLTLFGPPAPGAGPRIESAAVSPAWAGLEMITPLSSTSFATSNDERSIVLWDLSGTGLAKPSATLRYEGAVGVANSGALIQRSARPLLVTGHASGRLLIWKATARSPGFTLVRTLDLRSPDPVPSPYRLWNVRAVRAWRDEIVITGAEDGDLCLVDVGAGRILCRRRYNPAARRGINDVAVLENVALVGGCSVGTEDSNTWAFALRSPSEIEPLAYVDLVADPSSPQVFNFSVELARVGERTFFFCATEEGLLWVGELRGGDLQTLERLPVSSGLGAAVSVQPEGGTLAVVGDNVHLFRLRDLR
jgi:hypothetical protein